MYRITRGRDAQSLILQNLSF